MAGYHRSTTVTLLAVAVSIVATATEVVVRVWRTIEAAALWAVAKIPKPPQTWRPFFRVPGVGVMKARNTGIERRPVVCPRWRMCPST